jgi:hypothetical protein
MEQDNDSDTGSGKRGPTMSHGVEPGWRFRLWAGRQLGSGETFAGVLPRQLIVLKVILD